MTFSATDHLHMAHALRLAERGLYTTQPNPRVGCVLAHGDKIVGTGFHQRAGEPHAEVFALREAGARSRGATAYVTLEPCAHYGRTPPCAEALIAAGVVRVVVAAEDPNPHVAGRGMEMLRAAGITVDVGLMRDAARELNVGFFSRMERSRPWLRVKLAMSLDGRTALANGESQWITSEPARSDVQRWRARSSAILTGSGTVLADNPHLTVRLHSLSPGAAGG
ncbi:MAG: bifunctional diaminohydroxyphosphoribosylaminopyrimidine deaminase/5-amino-6-(5-phosphoribosylamino)uracil reductase RibD, partial [Rhodanobacter sp.]